MNDSGRPKMKVIGHPSFLNSTMILPPNYLLNFNPAAGDYT